MIELFERAITTFGVTDKMYDAGYIMPDGSMLNFGPFIEYIDGVKIFHHGNVKVLFPETLSDGEAAYKFTHSGAVRISPNGVAISKDIEPTDKEYAYIEAYCIANEEFFFVEFDTETDFDLNDTIYFPHPQSEEVIREIRRRYEH